MSSSSGGQSLVRRLAVRWVGPAALGAVSAVVVTTLINDRESEPRPPVVVRGHPGSAAATLERTPRTVLMVEGQRGTRLAGSGGTQLTGETGPRETEEEEETETRRREAFQSQLAAHDASERDEGWALNAERRVGPGLDEAAQRIGAAIVDTDCRRITCTATIEWADYATAQSTFGAFLTQFYELNCLRTILLDPPSDPSAVYHTRIYFDCNDETPLYDVPP